MGRRVVLPRIPCGTLTAPLRGMKKAHCCAGIWEKGRDRHGEQQHLPILALPILLLSLVYYHGTDKRCHLSSKWWLGKGS